MQVCVNVKSHCWRHHCHSNLVQNIATGIVAAEGPHAETHVDDDRDENTGRCPEDKLLEEPGKKVQR